jgi:hypothetical protein
MRHPTIALFQSIVINCIYGLKKAVAYNQNGGDFLARVPSGIYTSYNSPDHIDQLVRINPNILIVSSSNSTARR